MAILNVLTSPNPLLKQKSVPVARISQQTHRLIKDLFDTMKAYKGIGLAAPQVGILERVIVVGYKKRKMALINPVIVGKTGEQTSDEGCLSLPGITVSVSRAKQIVVQALLPDETQVTLEESGMIATIIQHEIDHLEGVLITQYGPPILRQEEEE